MYTHNRLGVCSSVDTLDRAIQFRVSRREKDGLENELAEEGLQQNSQGVHKKERKGVKTSKKRMWVQVPHKGYGGVGRCFKVVILSLHKIEYDNKFLACKIVHPSQYITVIVKGSS